MAAAQQLPELLQQTLAAACTSAEEGQQRVLDLHAQLADARATAAAAKHKLERLECVLQTLLCRLRDEVVPLAAQDDAAAAAAAAALRAAAAAAASLCSSQAWTGVLLACSNNQVRWGAADTTQGCVAGLSTGTTAG
jgi:hypothetical protein